MSITFDIEQKQFAEESIEKKKNSNWKKAAYIGGGVAAGIGAAYLANKYKGPIGKFFKGNKITQAKIDNYHAKVNPNLKFVPKKQTKIGKIDPKGLTYIKPDTSKSTSKAISGPKTYKMPPIPKNAPKAGPKTYPMPAVPKSTEKVHKMPTIPRNWNIAKGMPLTPNEKIRLKNNLSSKGLPYAPTAKYTPHDIGYLTKGMKPIRTVAPVGSKTPLTKSKALALDAGKKMLALPPARAIPMPEKNLPRLQDLINQ